MLFALPPFPPQTSGNHPVMTYEHYGRVRHARPYVLEITLGKGKLVYFGIGHTTNPADPQLAIVRQMWAELRPELALNEGGTPAPAQDADAATRRFGEPGFLRYFADRHGVPIRSLDPSPDEHQAALGNHFPSDRLKAFIALRRLAQDRRKPLAEQRKNPEALVMVNLATASRIRGLEGPPRTMAELEQTLARVPNLRGKWSDANDRWFDPGEGGAGNGFNAIATASSQYRDQYMIDRLILELRQGKRIFALMGASHVVMQEPALRAALPTAIIRRRMG